MKLFDKFKTARMAATFRAKGYTDFRVCKKCGHACTGYEFVAMCAGQSPDDCPECKSRDTLKRPWPLPRVARIEATNDPIMRECTPEEAEAFLKAQGLE